MTSTGANHGLQPVTITLEAGHWITLDLHGVTVFHEGQEKTTELGLAGNGDIFLPVLHTELGHDRLTRRHFLEFFRWTPDRVTNTWHLWWHVYEVVRHDLVGIAGEELLSSAAEQPPPLSEADLRQLAILRINDDGHTEWVILSGAKPRGEIVVTDAERQEVRERARARAAADAKVDWKLVREVTRAPELNYVDSDGCGNISVYGWSVDRTEAITVDANIEALPLSGTSGTFDLAQQRTGLRVAVHIFARPVREPFCTDVGYDVPSETWTAVGGIVTIERSSPGIRVRQPYLYRATIRIVGADFVSAAGVRIRQAAPITLTAIVGGVRG